MRETSSSRVQANNIVQPIVKTWPLVALVLYWKIKQKQRISSLQRKGKGQPYCERNILLNLCFETPDPFIPCIRWPLITLPHELFFHKIKCSLNANALIWEHLAKPGVSLLLPMQHSPKSVVSLLLPMQHSLRLQHLPLPVTNIKVVHLSSQIN